MNKSKENMIKKSIQTDQSLGMLSAEEISLVKEFREKQQRPTIGKAFEAALERARTECQVCIDEAERALMKLESISEEYGIPIRSSIVSLGRERLYTPKSFDKKWKGIDPEVLEENEVYVDSEGWEYWSTSSLSC